jgi:hypothetical protein
MLLCRHFFGVFLILRRFGAKESYVVVDWDGAVYVTPFCFVLDTLQNFVDAKVFVLLALAGNEQLLKMRNAPMIYLDRRKKGCNMQ